MKEFKYNAPDAFKKDKDSNNYKLLHLDNEIENGVEKVFSDLNLLLDIDNATGIYLDDYGNMFLVNRGNNSDDKYRIRIKGQIGQNFTDGTHNKVTDVLAGILECSPSDIKLTTGETTGTVKIDGIPLEILIDTGFTIEQINDLIEALLPLGVHIKSYNYIGTFEFSASEKEYDENKGFANNERSIGGFFGILGN